MLSIFLGSDEPLFSFFNENDYGYIIKICDCSFLWCGVSCSLRCILLKNKDPTDGLCLGP